MDTSGFIPAMLLFLKVAGIIGGLLILGGVHHAFKEYFEEKYQRDLMHGGIIADIVFLGITIFLGAASTDGVLYWWCIVPILILVGQYIYYGARYGLFSGTAVMIINIVYAATLIVIIVGILALLFGNSKDKEKSEK